MRHFIILSHALPISADFSLDDLPGTGRLDLLARCVTSTFCLSHALREAVRLEIIIQNSYTIRFEGAELRNLHPDERSTAALIRTALAVKDRAIGAMEANPSPGIYIGGRGVEETVYEAAESGSVYLLHEDGTPVREIQPPSAPVFVLSDHQNFTDAELAIFESLEIDHISLSPRSLHADQAISITHNWLDTAGFRNYCRR